MADDDFLNADEIDSLLDGDSDSTESDQSTPPSDEGETEDGLLDTAAIDALLDSQADAPVRTTPEDVLEQASQNLAAAINPHLNQEAPPVEEQTTPFQFEDFSAPSSPTSSTLPLETLEDVELDLRIELGRTELLINEVLTLKEGSVVPLDKLAGDPVDILVNGRLIARGEVLVLNDNFCVRVAEILAPEG